jgi:hypothetical protein
MVYCYLTCHALFSYIVFLTFVWLVIKKNLYTFSFYDEILKIYFFTYLICWLGLFVNEYTHHTVFKTSKDSEHEYMETVQVNINAGGLNNNNINEPTIGTSDSNSKSSGKNGSGKLTIYTPV